ncbi:MAG: 2-C-methyl-D-erythritol 4-phosphate cytidylyltransferase [Chloroflexi bacterium]|nr:2-C-methyl-D-erythritol 4-phosphate cytidylyltransferase [Chloroflexota bacterium]MDA1241146.1 2-C-methyl-D-erythritol 4-phosphate cytidylyltransferase [Chloroflexota bacterium]
MTQEAVAIVLAAGTSQRMGGANKIWADLGGRPVLARSLAVFASVAAVTRIVVVAPLEAHAAVREAAPAGTSVTCVAGGARRQDSVAAGLAAAPDAAWYLVHDGARPLLTVDLVARVLEGARATGAAIPVLPVADTIKRVDADGRVIETVDRGTLRAVQTPQAFEGALLRRAHAEVREDVTDDAAMVERLGVFVMTVPGEPANLKVTTPPDLVLALAWLAEREA